MVTMALTPEKVIAHIDIVDVYVTHGIFMFLNV